MRGRGLSFLAVIAGALLLCVGIVQIDAAFLRGVDNAAGKVSDVVAAPYGYAIALEGYEQRFVLALPGLGHPPAQALRDAAMVSLEYDVRAASGAHAVVGLSVDGVAYFSSAGYQTYATIFAFVVLVPGLTFLMLGLLGRPAETVQSGEVPECAVLAREAVVIAFPRRPRG